MVLEGVFVPGKGALPGVVPLPRPLQAPDKAPRLSVVLPEASEVLAVARAGRRSAAARQGRSHLRAGATPPRIEINWRQRRPELAIEVLVDVTLTGRQARVREHLRFLAVPDGLKEVVLASADIPENQAPIANGQPLTVRKPHTWVAAPQAGQPQDLKNIRPWSPAGLFSCRCWYRRARRAV